MQERYKFSFTAGGLLLNETVKVAGVYLQYGNWKEASKNIASTKILQKNRNSSSNRYFLEIQKRLKTLSKEEIAFLVEANYEEQKQIIFLSICRYYGFIRDFVIQVLRENMLSMKMVLRDSDYFGFINDISIEHPEIEALTETTRKKIRAVLFKILLEAGFIPAASDKTVSPVVVSSRVQQMLVSSNPRELSYFLYTDQQIRDMVNRNAS